MLAGEVLGGRLCAVDLLTYRIDLHLLPAYSPDCNPIERVRWHLHESVTRNHRCKSMQELLDLTFAWLAGRNPFQVEGSVYPKARAAA